MTTPIPKRRWYHVTPDRFFIGLLVLQVLLFLSERFQWFPFNEKKGCSVLIAVAAVCVAVLVMLIWGLVCLLLRRRFQFGFRSLLVLVVVVAVPCSWLVVEIKKAREQRELVAKIEDAHGFVNYDYECDGAGIVHPLSMGGPPGSPWLRNLLGDDFFRTVVSATVADDAGLKPFEGLGQLKTLWLGGFIDRTRVTDAGLEHLGKLTHLRGLDLHKSEVTDTGLRHLKGLSQLEWLGLSENEVTDAGLEHLKEMWQLRRLFLARTQVTDTGLELLKGLTHLQELNLEHTRITDVGLEHLGRLSELRKLNLRITTITDVGLEQLRGLAHLSELELYHTEVTDEGVKRLQQALPNCNIEH